MCRTQVTFNQSSTNGVLTISPTLALSEIGPQYTVTMAGTCVKDTASTPNAYGGLSGSTYQFTVADTYGPAVSVYSPAQGAVDVSNSGDIVLTFDEHVSRTQPAHRMHMLGSQGPHIS